MKSIKINFIRPAIITAAILMIPLVGMLVSSGWNWSYFDFVLIGTILFISGLAYELISSRVGNRQYKIASAIGVVTAVLLMWINLAVGIIGDEDNPANLMYLGVMAIGLIGAIVSQLKPGGMAKTLFSAAVLQMLIPIIAIAINNPDITSEPPGIVRVIILNAVFAMLWTASGLLFQQSSRVN